MTGKKYIILIQFILFGCASNQLYHTDFSYGEKMFSLGNYEEAIKAYTEFLKTNPMDERRIYAENKLSEAYYNLGKKYFEKGNYEKALLLFYSANTEKADKERARCYYSIANALIKENKHLDALQHLSTVIENFRDSDVYDDCLYLKLKIEFENLQNEAQCLETYKQLLQSFPPAELLQKSKSIVNKIARRYIIKADSLSAQGGYQSAIERYEEILEWASDYKQELQTKIKKTLINLRMCEGNEALQKQDLGKAEVFFQNVLELDPNNSEAKARLNEIASMREKIEKEERYKIFAAAHPDWSKQIIDLIMAKKIVEGMTTEMVKESWGPPDIIEHSSTYGTIYTYRNAPGYGKEVLVYFKNNKCYKILK